MMKLCTGVLLMAGVLWSGPLFAKAKVTTEDLGWMAGKMFQGEEVATMVGKVVNLLREEAKVL